MASSDKTALGNRLKAYEMEVAGRRLLSLIPTIARIDGRSFSSFTEGLERPYDKRLSDLMIATTKYLVQETNASCGYTQSDEISLTWYTDRSDSEIFFNGRIQKMESVLAGMTSTYFVVNLPKFLPQSYVDKLPHFDARVFNVPTLEEGTNCFLWRERDAVKNSISMAAQHYFKHEELINKNGSDMQEMLWSKCGINWNDYPIFFRRGSYVQKRKIEHKFIVAELDLLPPKHEARTNPDLTIGRTDYIRVDMPPFGKVINRVGVIYYGHEPLIEPSSMAREGTEK